MSTYMKYASKTNSQNGEDGILQELVHQLDIQSPGYFVEFGTGANGRDLSNTLVFAERGWSGLWIEPHDESFVKMKAITDEFGGRLKAVHGAVGFGFTDNLDVFLRSVDAPKTIDILSVDIDSYDLQVWKATKDHRATIVVIEINSGIPLGTHQVHDESVEPRKQGASFTSMLELGRQKGYRLVCHTGNMIFVDEVVADKLDMPRNEIDSPESLFNPMWVRWATGK